ncbi:MAG TPA: tripartite tricarboxylate transporter TctB family protein [Aurantimonas sp.]|nr:tripartite tricarboxylate transporter TctB family protein [Aurantimonas sp.]
MTDKSRDVLTGTVLLILGVAWMLMVWQTIPAGAGGGDVGPRAFPLLLGGLLALFSAAMIATALMRPEEEASTVASEPFRSEAETADGAGRFTALPLLLTFGHIVAYGYLMQLVGFVIATLVTVVSIMILCADDRSPLRIAAMSVGITFCCWLIFGKILGVYLATGSWINLG